MLKIEVIKIYKVTCTESVMMDEQDTGFSLKPWGKRHRSLQRL
jgi:hypothetical protein